MTRFLSVVFRQSTKSRSTAPLVPSNCSKSNTSPFLRYLRNAKVSFDFSTRIVHRMGRVPFAGVAKLPPLTMFLSSAGSAVFVLLPLKVLGWADDEYGGRSGFIGP